MSVGHHSAAGRPVSGTEVSRVARPVPDRVSGFPRPAACRLLVHGPLPTPASGPFRLLDRTRMTLPPLIALPSWPGRVPSLGPGLPAVSAGFPSSCVPCPCCPCCPSRSTGRLPEGGASPVCGPGRILRQRTRPATQTGPHSLLQGGRLALLSDRPSKSTGQGSRRIGRISARPSELIILIPLTSFAIVTKTLHCRRTPCSTARSMRRSM